MKAPTILLLCATAVGAIAFHPSAASAEVSFTLSIGNPASIYQPVIIEQRNPEWRYREEERIREEHRFAERRERERLAERREGERIAYQSSSHRYNSNNYQRSNNTQRDRYDR